MATCRRSAPGNTDAKGNGFVMTSAYFDTALGDGKAQIALAGARLAKMLDDIWPTPTGTGKKTDTKKK